VSDKPKRWGRGRTVFLSDLPAIRAEISRGLPLTEVFAPRSERLGIKYAAFCKLVARYAADARIKPTVAQQPNPQPSPAAQQGPPDVGREPRTFKHESQVTKTARERILGARPKHDR
jgi:hypothetical protein